MRTWTISISDDGAIAAGNTSLVTGDTIYQYVSVDDGTYIKNSYTTGENLTALDNALNVQAASIDMGWNVKINDEAEGDAAKVKPGDFVTLKQGANAVITREGTDVTFAVSDSPIFDGMVTANGFDANHNKIINVAPGTDASDVVILSQLNNLGDSVSTAIGGDTSYSSADQSLTVKINVRSGDSYTTYNNVNDAINAVQQTSSTYTAGDYIDLTDNVISVKVEGSVASGDTGIVTGDSVYQYVTVDDGTYIRNSYTTGENLTALDKVVAGHATSIDEISVTASKGWNLATVSSDGESTVSQQINPEKNNVRFVNGKHEDERVDNLRVTQTNTDNGAEVTFSIKDDPVFGGTVFATGGFDAMDNRITHVAAGSDDTDAVNMSQLRQATANAVLYDNDDRTTVTLNPGGSTTKITNLSKGAVNKDSTDAINGSQLYGVGKAIFGDTEFVDNEGNIKEFSITYQDGNTYSSVYDALYHTDKTVSGMKESFTTKKLTVNGDSNFNGDVTVSGKFTSNGPAVFNDTVTMNKGLKVADGNIDMSGKNRIVNLAPGQDDGDAVNVSQLKSVASRSDAMFSELDRGIRRAGARAAALAGLHPLPYDEDAPTTFTAAVGNYRGETSVALGLMHHFDRDTLFSVAGTVGKEPMLTAGISLRLGRYDEQVIEARKRKRRAAAEKNRLVGQISTQAVQIEKQKEELEALKARLNAMEKKIK